MPYPLPSSAPRQAPYLRLVPPSEMDDGRGTHRAEDEDPPTVDPTAEILKACGAMAVAVYHVARCNLEAGTPNKYDVLAEQCEVSVSTMHRIVRPMIGRGFMEVQTAGGGRGKQTVLSPVNRVINHVAGDMVSPETVSETVSKTVSKTVSAPPTPPVVNVNVPSNRNEEERELTPPNPPKPKPGPYREGFDAFWSAYPRHDKRKEAEAIWARLKPDAALLARMLDAIERQGIAAKEPQYRPMPTTWLNGERWKDEGATADATNGRRPPRSGADRVGEEIGAFLSIARGER